MMTNYNHSCNCNNKEKQVLFFHLLADVEKLAEVNIDRVRPNLSLDEPVFGRTCFSRNGEWDESDQKLDEHVVWMTRFWVKMYATEHTITKERCVCTHKVGLQSRTGHNSGTHEASSRTERQHRDRLFTTPNDMVRSQSGVSFTMCPTSFETGSTHPCSALLSCVFVSHSPCASASVGVAVHSILVATTGQLVRGLGCWEGEDLR